MKLFEKILVSIFSLAFILQFLDVYWKFDVFIIVIVITCLSYFISGYWLLNIRTNKKLILIPVVSGIAFSLSIFSLLLAIQIRHDKFIEFFPAASGVIFIVTGIWIILKKQNTHDSIKGTFLRAVVITILTSFFLYTPVTFKPFRMILYYMTDSEYLRQNLMMFQYASEYEDCVKKCDCDGAITAAEKANRAGLIWLGKSSGPELDKIGVTFTNLYKAYKCKADFYFKAGEYQRAMNWYVKADSALLPCIAFSDYWRKERCFSLVDIAECHIKSGDFRYGDSILIRAANDYKVIHDTADANTAFFLGKLGNSLANQQNFKYSNLAYKASIAILSKYGKTSEKETFNYLLKIIENHLQADSLIQAAYYIEKGEKLIEGNEALSDCKLLLYKGLYWYKMSRFSESESVLSICKVCYEKMDGTDLAEVYRALAYTQIALAKYQEAGDYIQKAKGLAVKQKVETRIIACRILSANLNMILGNYNQALEEYESSYKLSVSNPANKLYLLNIYLNLARLELKMSDYPKSQKYLDRCLKELESFNSKDNLIYADLLNNLAFASYGINSIEVAEKFYTESVSVISKLQLENTTQFADALNGLGLIMTEKRKFWDAENYFVRSLGIYRKLFGESHPSIAQVYFNQAFLCIKKNESAEAIEMINKSLGINRRFFDKNHDVFGDINSALGDIALMDHQPSSAYNHYESALKIYKTKFQNTHQKIISVKRNQEICKALLGN